MMAISPAAQTADVIVSMLRFIEFTCLSRYSERDRISRPTALLRETLP